jgi:transcriptional regulator with XRE-family HTH domain
VIQVVGLRVKQYLDENGIKYSYLSEKTGIPMNMLSPTLNGKRKMSAEEYFMICEVLGVSAELFSPSGLADRT